MAISEESHAFSRLSMGLFTDMGGYRTHRFSSKRMDDALFHNRNDQQSKVLINRNTSRRYSKRRSMRSGGNTDGAFLTSAIRVRAYSTSSKGVY